MHPFQENSPVESLNDWVHFTSGLKEYERHPSFDDVILPAESPTSSSGASNSIPSWFDVLAIVIGLFAVGFMVYKNLVMSVASGAVALSLSSSLCTSDSDMLVFNAMAASLFGSLIRAMKVN